MINEIEALKQEDGLWTRDFILISIIGLFTFLGFQMLMPTLPLYAKFLGGTDAHAGLVVGIFTFAAVIIRPFTGYALDAYGRKGIFFIGMFIFTACVFGYMWVPSLLILLLLRFVHGFGWGLTSTAASTVAADVIPRNRMGEGMGYYGLAPTLSMALAPALGLFIISHYNFNVLFSLSTVLIIIAILLALFINYQKVAAVQRKFQLIEKDALVPSLVVLFITMTYGAIVSFLAIYAGELGISNIGLFFTIYAIALTITRPIAGRLADKRGFDLVVIPGISFITIAMVLLFFANSMTWFLVAAVVYGIGFGSTQPALLALAIVKTSPKKRGGANATFFTGFDLGIGIGSIMWGLIVGMVGYSWMYLLATIPALIGLGIYFVYQVRGNSVHFSNG
ncbi:MAG TPA: MFS transporter [Syntrophomonadaceae bacterium]|nr:MFS transporter [Syntrophomonadaceae bacterium]